MNGPQPLPGWYPDPRDSRLLRWWNGTSWTSDTRPVAALPATPATTDSGSWWTTWSVRKGVLVGVATLLVIGMIGSAFGDGKAPADLQHGKSAGHAAPSQSSAPAVPTAKKPAPPPKVRVPAVSHASIASARAAMRSRHLRVSVVRHYSWVAAGTVLAQHTRPGRHLVKGSVVQLVVAKAMPRVPGVTGRAVGRAVFVLRRAGFGVRRVSETVTSGTTGSVLRQTPNGLMRAKPGATVTVVVAHVVHPVVHTAPAPPAQPSNCTPGYSPCLTSAYDYDCAGGSGDGPKYANGPVMVTGSDPYGLDADGDGVACEW